MSDVINLPLASAFFNPNNFLIKTSAGLINVHLTPPSPSKKSGHIFDITTLKLIRTKNITLVVEMFINKVNVGTHL
jgi:hypothetical protein